MQFLMYILANMQFIKEKYTFGVYTKVGKWCIIQLIVESGKWQVASLGEASLPNIVFGFRNKNLLLLIRFSVKSI